MENNNRESLFANAARESFGSIDRFAKDLYSAISENSRLSKDIDKANTSDDYYEDKKETQEKKLNDLLERSQYLSNLISRQFKELINNLKSFLDSVTGGLGLGVLGGVLGLTAASPLLFGESQVEETDWSDGDYDPESPATPRNNNNFEGEPLSDDLAAPLEGAEGVVVEFSPGPRRPNPPSYGVVNAVRNAVFSTFGEGYRIVITSGEGEYGSVRHREEAGGAAIDYKIVDPDGNPVSINDSRIRNYLKSLGEQGIKGHGMGREYMGEYTMHSDIFPREYYTEGMGPTWGDGWMDNEVLEPGQKSLRETFLEASSGVDTPRTGGSVRIENGKVDLPTLEEFIQELSSEEPEETQTEEEITPTPAQDITGGGGDDELTGGDNLDRLQGTGVQDTPETVAKETTEVPETPVPEPEVTEAIPESNPTPIDVGVTESPNEQPTTQPQKTPDQENPQNVQTAGADLPKLSESVKNFLDRSDYKKEEQELSYA